MLAMPWRLSNGDLCTGEAHTRLVAKVAASAQPPLPHRGVDSLRASRPAQPNRNCPCSMMGFQSSGDSRYATCLFVLLRFPVVQEKGPSPDYLFTTSYTLLLAPCWCWRLPKANLITHQLSGEGSVSGSWPLDIHPPRTPGHLDLERSSPPLLPSFTTFFTCLLADRSLSISAR